MKDLIDNYITIKECDYKGEHYSVRDNGAIMRHSKGFGHLRKWDNVWTMGKKDDETGYMLFASSVRVHRIVATAFLGNPENDELIVDHKDSNRCNNRPDNLRWITRLENILNNPITRAKVELICGSISAFIENPSLLYGHETKDDNFVWMRSVTPEEAKVSYERWIQWANLSIEERRRTSGGPGEWILKTESALATHHSQFVKCPQGCWLKHCPFTIKNNINAFDYYINQLTPSVDFLYTIYYKVVVEKVYRFDEVNKARVLTRRVNNDGTDTRKPWQIYEIWEDGLTIIHEHVATYGKKQLSQAEAALQDLNIRHLEDWKFKSVQVEKRVEQQIHTEHPFHVNIDTIEVREEREFVTADNVVQVKWKTPSEFPLCPKVSEEDGLQQYYENLKKGELFCRNRYGESFLVDFALTDTKDEIIVMNHLPDSLKEWALSKIYYCDGVFVHESIGTYFAEEGAQKYFALELGREWTGGDILDDYC